MELTKSQKEKFQRTVWDFYKEQGRHTLPWRQTADPYRVLVSELMLQQTQVDRVVPKYQAFIEHWPTVTSLAETSLGEVLRAWQGLGYNRRAKFLHQAARNVEEELGGVFPNSEESLRSLPGVGPYTAAAIMVFAFNERAILIETNIRQVIIFHFLPDNEQVSDKEILEMVEKTLPETDFRSWYAAMMDYGSYLKKEYGNLTRRSTAYNKQSPFIGSDRQIRGAILRVLGEGKSNVASLQKKLDFDQQRIIEQLQKLRAEGLVIQNEQVIYLP